jgi:hypothetical protein
MRLSAWAVVSRSRRGAGAMWLHTDDDLLCSVKSWSTLGPVTGSTLRASAPILSPSGGIYMDCLIRAQ